MGMKKLTRKTKLKISLLMLFFVVFMAVLFATSHYFGYGFFG